MGKKKKYTRQQVEGIVDSILEANFWMAGTGHFNITYNEMVNIFMIALNNDNKENLLKRYYRILEKKYLGKWLKKDDPIY